MRILGISADYHDASAALVIDGRVVAAASEERFTRVRHDASFPVAAIHACLAAASLEPGDVDCVVYYEDPSEKFTRVLAALVAQFPASLLTFTGAMARWLSEKLWIRERLARHLGVSAARVLPLRHHVAHAAQSFLQSPFQDSAIITLDAVGEWTCSAISSGVREGRSARVDTLVSVEYPNSLGLFYSAFTQFLGFRPNSDECSTMALSSFGAPRYTDRVREVLEIAADGTPRLDLGHIQPLDAGAPFSKRFLALFGPPRDPGEPLPFDVHDPSVEADPRAQYYADLAASAQRVLEDGILSFARRALDLTGNARLCLAGGVALNCVAVARLLATDWFEDIFIPYEPGDGGAALGAALYGATTYAELTDPDAVSPYLGPPGVRVNWQEFLGELARQLARSGAGAFRWRKIADPEERATTAARLLGAGRIVGWCSGRAEFGPRALGNRSILAAPHVEVARRLSRKVKRRAPFRPYALATSERYARQAFELDGEIPRCARRMQTVVRARPAYRAPLQAGLHIDGTTRLQICEPDDNPEFSALLREYGRQHGGEALINTSLNLRGEPIVQTPLQGLSLFLRSELDALVADDFVLWKAS